MSTPLRDDARAIWQAAVDAVDSARLVARVVVRDGADVEICGERFALADTGRIVVVGAGKAGAGMAAGLEAALGPDLVDQKVTGWVNVPADCVRPLRRIHLHAARPPARNEPTEAGVAGSARILELAASLQPRDVCLVLLSGGGSALLPAPAPGVTLQQKLDVTRLLMNSGATIEELNAVRSCLSRLKGGGLVRAMPAGRCRTLIISDVVGDPLHVIASGPTVPQTLDRSAARQILLRYAGSEDRIPPAVWACLRASEPATAAAPGASVANHIIGNNRTALEAAAAEACRRGYALAALETDQRGVACEIGAALAARCLQLQAASAPGDAQCLLSGGEPVVHLAPTDQPRRGGRNQEVALAAVVRLWDAPSEGIVVLSGGTDGEDGPTDAAGALADAEVIRRARALGLDPRQHLAINNSYPFFEQAGGLIKTGPTHTNVMDVRVALVRAGKMPQ